MPLTAGSSRRAVVVDIEKLRPAAKKLPPVKQAAEKGIELIYVNTAGMLISLRNFRTLTDGADLMMSLFMPPFRPSRLSVDDLLAEDGCLNFRRADR